MSGGFEQAHQDEAERYYRLYVGRVADSAQPRWANWLTSRHECAVPLGFRWLRRRLMRRWSS